MHYIKEVITVEFKHCIQRFNGPERSYAFYNMFLYIYGSSVFGSCTHSKVQVYTGYPLIQVEIVSLTIYM